MRSSVVGNDAGAMTVQHITSPRTLSRNSISETEKTCTERKRQLQNIKHRTQIVKEKYFCILAYKHETNYKCLSHRHKIFADNGAIHRRANQPWSSRGGLAVNLSSVTGSFTSSCQPLQNGYLLAYIGRRTDSSLP